MDDITEAWAYDAWIAQHIWVWSRDDDGTWRDMPFAHEADAVAFETHCRQFGFPTSRTDPR